MLLRSLVRWVSVRQAAHGRKSSADADNNGKSASPTPATHRATGRTRVLQSRHHYGSTPNNTKHAGVVRIVQVRITDFPESFPRSCLWIDYDQEGEEAERGRRESPRFAAFKLIHYVTGALQIVPLVLAHGRFRFSKDGRCGGWN